MVVGNGQIAREFESFFGGNNVPCIFASGVSRSDCTDSSEFTREKVLCKKILEDIGGTQFVYFSSSALSDPLYPMNDYYNHKLQMENLIRENSNNYHIFRVPQVFGPIGKHHTLVNFLYYQITNGRGLSVYSHAFRYVLDVSDLALFVRHFIRLKEPNLTTTVANPKRYSIFEIIAVIEDLVSRKAVYKIIDRMDSYQIELAEMMEFLSISGLDFGFGENYFQKKFRERVSNAHTI